MLTDADPCTLSLPDAAARIARRELSPVDLTEAMLERIERLDGAVRSYLRVTPELARERARRAERELAEGRGPRGPLHGIPVGLKDLVYTRGIPTTCASTILRDFRPGYDAHIVEQLDAAGAVPLGKLHMTEFALYGYHPDFAPPANPWRLDHWAGVSSSGSGAAVAAGLCFAAIGTDTGGSIRFPSAACGVVGIKPTFGKVSRYGVFPLADSLDHVGPMARTVAGAAAMLSVLEGRDPRDPSTRSDPPADYDAAIARGLPGLRIGIDRDYCATDTHPDMASATFAAADRLAELGAELVDVCLPDLTDVCELWGTTAGVDALLHHRAFFPERAQEYGPVFRAFLEGGAGASAEAYARGERLRSHVRGTLDELFTRVDCLLCPGMPSPAPPQADVPPQRVAPPEELASLVRFAAPFNYAGVPSVTLPNGFTAEGLPLAMQLVARAGDEATAIRAAAGYEAGTEWHRRRPPL